MRFYISGPMTGLPDLNFPAFNAEAARLREQGFAVVNPAELNPDPQATWKQCMRLDIRHLVECDAIVMLPGWERSRGARLERHIAIELGLTVLDQAPAAAGAELVMRCSVPAGACVHQMEMGGAA